MSATDSDNSIDWLASDNEDSESERETDPCTRTHSQTEAPPTPRALPHLGPTDCDVKKGDRKWREVREPCSAGSPPGRMETYDGAIGLCKTHGEKTNGRNTQQALKRPHSFTEEEERKAQQLNSNMTEKDQFFTRRYRERLSSFQESVAMDRIQRIMGVLQNPRMGEKYINIILKMEEMLKSWFPNVKLQNQPAVAHTETAVPTKRSKVEL